MIKPCPYPVYQQSAAKTCGKRASCKSLTSLYNHCCSRVPSKKRMAHLAISLLGPFRVTLDEKPIAGLKSNKIRALLSYLAIEAERPHHRRVLAELLWPNRPGNDSLKHLRYALSNLRRAIGDREADPPFLYITRDTLQFNRASDCRMDVWAFNELASLAQTHAQDTPPSTAVDRPLLIGWSRPCSYIRATLWRDFTPETASSSRSGCCSSASS
jgi:hypothetical protein